ncbi:MAG: hypothetical protein J4F46_05690 [Dehalococcoidia bacterium]|nr:hypothetical protein [Dehalococcoidia bacterium]
MPIGEEKVFQTVTSFLERQNLEYEATEEQHCDKLKVRNGTQVAYVSIYNTGSITVQGKDSTLKKLLDSMKVAIDDGNAAPGQALPFEIDKLPETIREGVPDCDPVIIRYVEEAIRCVHADALLGAAFMIGVASEKAISNLIDTYTKSISDKKNQKSFLDRIKNRSISKKYEEFIQSYKSCKSKPTETALSQDLDTIIGAMFQFYRITRNEIGHPQDIPDLVGEVILANLGQFATYIKRIYALIQHFREKGIVL